MGLPYHRKGERGKHSHQAPGTHGSPNAKRPAPPPSPTEDIPVIGDFEWCWCGEKYGHDWEGKERGKKHPR